jgi:hypothetical protein
MRTIVRTTLAFGLAILVIIGAFVSPHSTSATGEEQGPFFVDVTESMGLKGMSGGVAAWGDFDNDGWVDLCVGGEIWRNEEGKRFKKIGQVAGPAIWGDFDNDGYLDLFCFESGKLFRNINGREFKEVDLIPRLPTKVSLGATWGDFNGDGFVDLYVGGYEVWPAEEFPDVILMNDHGKKFTETWRQTQIYRARGVTTFSFQIIGCSRICFGRTTARENSPM